MPDIEPMRDPSRGLCLRLHSRESLDKGHVTLSRNEPAMRDPLILVGIDDTDVAGSRGTNQLARRIVRELSGRWRCIRIVRHQLLQDPRVPCTTKNGSASIALRRRGTVSSPCHNTRGCLGLSAANPQSFAVWGPPSVDPSHPAEIGLLLECFRNEMRNEFLEGSDPGLCLLMGSPPAEIVAWGLRCQRELVTRDDAFAIAARTGVHLESLGGSEDGVIGALAAVGLASTQNDGRIVQLGEWPDDLSGLQTAGAVSGRGVRVQHYETAREITHGEIEIGKQLRPNLRNGEPVLFVESDGSPSTETYRAVRLP